jgi:hypothetical protein
MWKERLAMFHARRISLAVVALLALLGAVPQPAAAGSLVPFRATMVENVQSIVVSGSNVDISIVGAGQATHLGNTSEASNIVVDLSSSPGSTSYGSNCHNNTRTVTLTGANGDQITLALTGISCDTGATTGTTGISQDTYVVMGGTGRYSGATGGGTDTVYIHAPSASSPPVSSVTIFTGTLSTPGSLP